MRAAAFQMEAPLEAAVKNVQKYYHVFQGNEAVAFEKWDSCAQKILRVIRDNPISGRMPATYRPYFAVGTGIDLQTAYNAYVTKRQQYRSAPIQITAILKNIIDQNKALYAPNLRWPLL